MKEVGTLKELDVKAGDVIEYVSGSAMHSTRIGNKYTVSNCGTLAIGKDGHNSVSECTWIHRIVSRTTPKLWRDMTPEEKGALLLAAHEGKVVQATRLDIPDDWRPCVVGIDNLAYRIKPNPKVEVVTNTEMYITSRGCIASNALIDGAKPVILTYTKTDGVIDLSSYKLEYR